MHTKSSCNKIQNLQSVRHGKPAGQQHVIKAMHMIVQVLTGRCRRVFSSCTYLYDKWVWFILNHNALLCSFLEPAIEIASSADWVS